MRRGYRLQSLIVLVLAFAATISAASADEKKPQSTPPGVDGNYSIVRPAPSEPEAEPDRSKGSSLAPGKWDITISGSVTVDITTGNLPLPRR